MLDQKSDEFQKLVQVMMEDFEIVDITFGLREDPHTE